MASFFFSFSLKDDLGGGELRVGVELGRGLSG